MLIKVKKLWMGHASVRDYIIRGCINRGEDLMIEFDGECKNFPHSTLMEHLNSAHITTVRSKFDGKQYDLVDFPWL